jgi:hypothetical protein
MMAAASAISMSTPLARGARRCRVVRSSTQIACIRRAERGTPFAASAGVAATVGRATRGSAYQASPFFSFKKKANILSKLSQD